MAAVADPDTGVAIYDTYSQGGWLEVGGTSVASPIIASVFALAGKLAAGTYPDVLHLRPHQRPVRRDGGQQRHLPRGDLVQRGGGLRRPDRLGHPGRHGAFTG